MKINFKSKKFWIFLVVAVVLLVAVLSMVFGGSKSAKYETAKVERGNLVQTVDATGTLGSTDDLSLYFVSSGIVQNIKVEEGDSVKAGQWLANLSLSQLNASVDQAQASLDQKLAGATSEQIDVSQRQVESAQVSLDQAQKSLTDTTALSEKNLSAKYSAAQNSLADAYIKMYNAYATVDSIAKNYFSGNDQEGLSVRYNESYMIKAQMDNAKKYIDAAKVSGSDSDIDAAISASIESLGNILSGLTGIRSTCDSTNYQSYVTAADKASLDSQKAYISSAQTSVSQLQSDISILKTQNDNSLNSATAAVKSAQAALDLQKANYDSLVAKPRDVDIAYYQAALQQAVAARNNAIIYAPINGIVTKVNKKVGELIGSSEPMIEMSSPDYQIEVDVPETDVVKIKVGDEATITFDALGNDNKFAGKVISIDPSSTEIQDVVYYKVKVGLGEEDNISLLKTGMTADVVIKTDSRDNAIFVKSQAILSKSDTGEKYVRVLKNGKLEERPVTIGLKGDDGQTEITAGLSEGEEIVLRTE